jgi:gamma-glutamyltranspeptidase / glutathione hydrolase
MLSHTAQSKGGMAATAFPAASEAACEMLRAGGNAIDAAAAAAWALSVCEPSGSGLGGQTTMLVRLSNGRSLVIDGHSYAPAAVSVERVSRGQQKMGHRACVIPSTPATLDYAQRRYGRLRSERVLEPAIRLAEDGYAITRLQRRQLRLCQHSLSLCASTASLFLHNGEPYQVGEIFRQPILAASLRRLAEFGVSDFYAGRIAHAIAQDMRANDGLLCASDLANSALPVEREPLHISYRGYEVLSVPPPGGGVPLLHALNLLEALAGERNLDSLDEWYVTLAEVIHAVFQERERDPVHSANWSAELNKDLLGKMYTARMTAMIQNSPALTTTGVAAEEVGETTHLCTADVEGNVVSLTQSIQSVFGAKVANAKVGFLYNNYLTTCPRRSHPYQLGPGCLARSNASPTLVLQAGSRLGEPLLAVGAAGSRRILSAVLQVISGVVDRKLPLGAALAMPRIHAKLNREIWLEEAAATQPLRDRLAQTFGDVRVRRPLSFSMGATQAIQFNQNGTFVGAADPRRDGAAIGV